MLNQLSTYNKLITHANQQNFILNNQKDYLIKLKYLSCNFSNHLINPTILQDLLQLANEADVTNKIQQMFRGEKINTSEQRQVLHTALRTQNSIPEISLVKNKMRALVTKILSHTSNITDVINIGIGGSDLGPKMAYYALRPFWNQKISCHFISNVDPSEVSNLLKDINVETSLFIISSKSFSTIETLTNAKLVQAAGASHFVAVTANTAKAIEFGISAENIFPMWDFVGGRYSLWSAIGLPIALGTSWEIFEQLLAGAAELDQHFLTQPLEHNLPVILALLSIWYRNFLHTSSEAVIPYASDLRYLVDHLQQLIMESNGKNVSITNEPLAYKTSPIIWGGLGTNCQHAFMQLLHQGPDLIPCDFIAAIDSCYSYDQSQKILLANLFAQIETLKAGDNNQLEYKKLLGNKPSNLILLEKLTPEALGSLIALYEHKTFVQGILWNINSFDQWGVEKGKICAEQILKEINSPPALDGYLTIKT